MSVGELACPADNGRRPIAMRLVAAFVITVVSAACLATHTLPSNAAAANTAKAKIAAGKQSPRKSPTAASRKTRASTGSLVVKRVAASRKLPKTRLVRQKAVPLRHPPTLAIRLKGKPSLLAFARLPQVKPVKERRRSKAVRPTRPLSRLRQASLIVPRVRLQPAELPDHPEAGDDTGGMTGDEVYLSGPQRRFSLASVSFAFSEKVRLADNVVAVCLPTRLKQLLNEIAEAHGEVLVSSAVRSPLHNAQVGGAPRSLHLDCLAIDFLVGGPRQEVYEVLKANAWIGGLSYYRDGHFHIDCGPRRIW